MKWNKFICPIDALSITEYNGVLRCENGHTFDLAREGYCNLLLVQQKASSDPGDSNEMVMARRRFLEAGFYSPLAEKVALIVNECSQNRNGFRVLDAGSGEGYYLRQLQNKNPKLELIGIDISKHAVKAAAKLNQQISWAVASNKNLPLQAQSIDLILCMFGFPVWSSFSKLQKNQDHVLLVDPAENHLIELRKIIYPNVTNTAISSIEAALQHGYRLVKEEPLQFSIHLNNQQQINDLLSMTPHAYRISELGLKNLSEFSELNLSVDLSLRLLVR